MMRSLVGGMGSLDGKAIDTNKYFVICTDNLCNVQVRNPYVITTGPKSINPETGEEYAMEFPVLHFLM